MNIIFMGTPTFSTSILEAVHKKYGVSLVVTQPDKLVGRKKVLTFSPVKQKAVELGIEVFQPRSIKQDFQKVLDLKPDLIITAAFGQWIPNEVLDYPRLGCINVHGSILPKLRGGAPIQRAIKRGYKETGITIMYMAEKMDSGDIISQRTIPILDTDTSGSMFEKLSILGEELLLDTVPSIIDGTNNRIKQNEEEVTYAYNLRREEEKVDFNQSKKEIDCHLRAFTPYSYIYTTIDNLNLKIISLKIDNDVPFETIKNLENGTIFNIEKEYFQVKVNDGVINIYEVQLAGKQRQLVKVFLNGAGRKLIQVNKIFK